MTVSTTGPAAPPGPDFTIKANDTLPVIQARLGYEGTLAGPALTGAQVFFIMRPVAGGATKVNAAASVVSVSGRTVQYTWRVGDTDTPGDYLAEWEVHDAQGNVQTFPVSSYHTIRVLADLDGNGTVA